MTCDSGPRLKCEHVDPRPGRCQAELVPDEVGAIAAAVRAASEAAEVVVTSGGLGPTPDDVTMAGVSAGLGHPLARCITLKTLEPCLCAAEFSTAPFLASG